jgi:hypothetical protein
MGTSWMFSARRWEVTVISAITSWALAGAQKSAAPPQANADSHTR